MRKGSCRRAWPGQQQTLVLLWCRGAVACLLLWQHWQQCRCSNSGWPWGQLSRLPALLLLLLLSCIQSKQQQQVALLLLL